MNAWIRRSGSWLASILLRSVLRDALGAVSADRAVADAAAPIVHRADRTPPPRQHRENPVHPLRPATADPVMAAREMVRFLRQELVDLEDRGLDAVIISPRRSQAAR